MRGDWRVAIDRSRRVGWLVGRGVEVKEGRRKRADNRREGTSGCRETAESVRVRRRGEATDRERRTQK